MILTLVLIALILVKRRFSKSQTSVRREGKLSRLDCVFFKTLGFQFRGTHKYRTTLGAISSIAVITAIVAFVTSRILNIGQLTFASTSYVYSDGSSQLLSGRQTFFDIGFIGKDKVTGSYVHLDDRMIKFTAS